MPQQSRVQKILTNEGFRSATEAVYRKQSSESEGRDILARCKALNDFVKKGLLGQVEDSVKPTPQQRRRHTGAGAAQAVSGKERQLRKTASDDKTRTPSDAAAATPHAASLDSRFTAKETEALLELLLFDEVTPARSHQQFQHQVKPSSTSCCSSNGQEAQHTEVWPSSSTTSSAAVSMAAAANEGVLDEVIGLLNADPDSLTTASSSSRGIEAGQQQQGLTLLAIPESPHILAAATAPSASASPQATCREAHRQAWVLPELQQQQELVDAASKHASISAAWLGYYSFWGPHAASTIQHYWRGHRLRAQYQQLQQAALVLQAITRGWLARRDIGNMMHACSQQGQQGQQSQLSLRCNLQQQQQQEDHPQGDLHLKEQAQHQEQLHMQVQDGQHPPLPPPQQQQQEHAAIVLQCAVRSWLARALLEQKAAEAKAAGLVATAADTGEDLLLDAMPRSISSCVQSTHSICTASSGSSESSSGCSRSARSRCSTAGSTQSMHLQHHAGVELDSGAVWELQNLLDSDALGGTQQQPCSRQEQPPASSRHSRNSSHDRETKQMVAVSGSHVQEPQYTLAQVVIRSAADTRTASYLGELDAGKDCKEPLAQQLVDRAVDLEVCEGLKAAGLASRTVMASSSFRQLQTAMQIVKGSVG